MRSERCRWPSRPRLAASRARDDPGDRARSAPAPPAENHLVQRAGRISRTKGGIEDSKRRAKGIETGLARHSKDRLPSFVLLSNA
jgi:hypothetical protein